MTSRCSDHTAEPLPGTAKRGEVFVLLEHPGPWSRDILDGGTFDAATTELLQGVPGLHLIRKPGRAGRRLDGPHNVYLIFAKDAIAEHLTIDDPRDLLRLDYSGPHRNDGTPIDAPILLVCTHAKRDQCCAVNGRPIAQALVEKHPDAHIWESSHTKGHRFAPALMLFPHGYAFGRLNAAATLELFAASMRGELFVPGNRGRAIFDARAQVAEIAVGTAVHPEPIGLGELRVDGNRVFHPDGRSWRVTMHRADVEGVVASCGKPPKTAASWVVDEVIDA